MQRPPHFGLLAILLPLSFVPGMLGLASADTSTPNGGGDPVWSPDGQRIAFLSATPNTPVNVWVTTRDGHARQLTRTGGRVIGWSPRGDKLYVETMSAGVVARLAFALDGSSSPILGFLPPSTAAAYPSPDGREVAYLVPHEKERDLWVANWNGDSARQLTHGVRVRSAMWRPDGRWIAYDVGGIMGEETLVADTQSQVRPRDLFLGAANAPSWSPDGRLVAVLGMHTVTILHADGSPSNRLHMGQLGNAPLSWSPDSKRLALVTPDQKVLSVKLVDVVTGKADVVSTGWQEAAFARWSPDGRRLVFEATAPGEPNSAVRVLDLTTRAVRNLTAAAPSSWAGVWSGDGKSVYLTSNATANGGSYLCQGSADGKSLMALLPADPRIALQISWPKGCAHGLVVGRDLIVGLPLGAAPTPAVETEHPTSADLAPDGQTMAYVKWLNHRSSIVLRQLKTGTETELLPPPEAGAAYSKLAWSPTGERIAFVRGGAVCAIPAAGGDVTVLASALPGSPARGEAARDTLVLQPEWSPDGKRLVFGRFRRVGEQRLETWLVEVAEARLQMIASSPVVAERALYADPLTFPYAWSPDSRLLVLCAELEGEPALYSVDLGTGTPSQPVLLRAAAAYPSFSPDGQGITYTALDGNRERLRVLRLADGVDRPLALPARATMPSAPAKAPVSPKPGPGHDTGHGTGHGGTE